MEDKYSFKKTFSNTRFLACVSTIFIMTLLVSLTIIRRDSFAVHREHLPYADMWSYESGALVDFDNLKSDDHYEIHKRTDGEEINTNNLCFFSKNIYFTIYVDGEEVYDFHPEVPAIYGKSYGVYPHSVSMPILYRDGDIKIVIDNIYKGKAGYIKDLHLDNSNNFLISQLQLSTPKFIICLIIFILGFVLFTISLFGKYFGDARFEIISMGCLGMVASLWIATDSKMYMLLTANPTVVHFVQYITLDMLSYPAIVFASFVTGNKKSKLSILIGVLTLIKVGTSMVLTALGLYDYHELLSASHVLLGISSITFFYLLFKGLVQKTVKSFITKVLVITFSTSVILGVIDIFRFIQNRESYERISLFKYSLFAFIFICGLYEFIMITEMSKRGKYAEIMEELAYQDDLTRLLNRKAFNKKISIIADGDTVYTLVMMDLNYLKKVNDELGHTVGDEYIKYIAKSISESFPEDEGCFRIGGDEFFVITNYGSDSEDFYNCMKTLNNKINEFNKEKSPSIKMALAYGHAEYNPRTDSFDKRFKEADNNMYDMKAKMKGQ